MIEKKQKKIDLDHVTVAGKEVESLMNAFQSIGMDSLYGGKHSSGLTEMAIVRLGDGSYIELVSATKEAKSDDVYWWKPFIQGNAGICAWCLRSENIEMDTQIVAEAGLSTEGPKDFVRHRPDGKAVQWKLTFVDNLVREPGTIYPFLIEDHTDRNLRVPEKAKLSPELLRVGRIMIGVSKKDEVIRKLRDLYQIPKPILLKKTDEISEYHFEQTPIVIGVPKSKESPLGRRLSEYGECLYGMVLEVNDLKRAQQSFKGFNRKEMWGDDPVLWNEKSSDSPLKEMKLGIMGERSRE